MLVERIFHKEAGDCPQDYEHLAPLRVALVPNLDIVHCHICILSLYSLDGFIVRQDF